ncbi:MAG TPA: hypothetical protein VMH91_04505 [Candidatus Paceibacterota bacterium]|nr:hypothetical protein [Candidatus Paceibacterota bacterium]
MDQPNGMMPPAAQKNTLMGILCYLGPLVIVSYLAAKDDPFVKFHIRQGLVLFAIEVILWILTSFFWQLYMLWPLYDLIDLALFVLSVLGIVNVVQGKETPLPLVGSWGNSFPL